LLAVRIDSTIIEEAQKIASATGFSLAAYIARAIRHFNQYHARVRNNHLRSPKSDRVIALFPPQPDPPPSQPRRQRPRKRRRR